MAIPVTVITPQYDLEVYTNSGLISLRDWVVMLETFTTCRDMAGGWRAQLVFREDPVESKNYYEILNPMDYVRIKMGNSNDSSSGPTTVMRGFITHVEQSFQIQDGTPMRIINLVGDNYAKLIKMGAIHYIMGLDPPSIIAAGSTKIPVLFGWGINLLNSPPSQVISDVFNKLVMTQFTNVKNALQARHQSDQTNNNNQISKQIDGFGVDVDANGTDGTRDLQGMKANGKYQLKLFDMSAATSTTMIHDFLNEYCCRPWNEIFVDDAPSQSWLVFRPFPYRNRDGNFLGYTAFGTGVNTGSAGYNPPSQERSDALNPLTVTPEETVSFMLKRSDEEIVNYLFTNAIFASPGANFEHTAYSLDTDNTNPHFTVNFTSNPNGGLATTPPSPNTEYSQMELFGFREVRWPTKYISVAPDNLSTPDNWEDISSNLWKLSAQLNMIMFYGMEHVSQLESGEIIIRGREDIRPGMYIKFRYQRDDPNYYMYYVADVSQSLIPYQSWLTKITVVRGEGHLKPVDQSKTSVDHVINTNVPN